METILEIKEIDGEYKDIKQDICGWEVRTNKRELYCLIASFQDCCEDWGYIISEDKPDYFIGATLLSVTEVDDELKVKDVAFDSIDDYSSVFINFETSKGTFQLTVYNGHNGYYGHEVYYTTDSGTKWDKI